MKNLKKLVAIVMIIASIMCMVFPAHAAATTGFDVLSKTNYAKTYTLSSSGKTIPYTSNKLTTRGTVTYGKSNSSYIDNKADELYIVDVGKTNDTYWAYVSYPTSSKRVYAYIPLSAISKNNGTHVKTISTGKFYCSLRENTSNSSSYWVGKGDVVYLIATSNSKCQILYPISGGKWRLAFCNTSDYQKYCGGTTNTEYQNTDKNNTTGLTDVTAYFAGKQIVLQSVQNGKYLCADANYKNTPAMANRSNTTTWTTFTVSSLTGDGWVGIKANTNKKYLSATNNVTDTPVRSVANSIQMWECFRIYLKDNTFFIKAQVNNKFLCVRVDKPGAPVQAYASVADSWERFNIRFVGNEQYVSAAELIRTSVNNGLGANSNAYKALSSINGKYAGKLTDSQEKGIAVFMFEGVGNNSNASKRMNAMCVVIKDGKIVYLNRNSSTIPDYPFTPSKNEGTPMPTIKSGIYSFTTVNHRGKYAALNVTGAQVVRFRSKSSFYNSTSSYINVHRRDTDYIPSSSAGWVNSAGCLLIGKSGKGSSSEYASFIKAVGLVGGGATGNSKYSSWRSGTIIVDRTYAGSYLSNVGYSASAIKAIG